MNERVELIARLAPVLRAEEEAYRRLRDLLQREEEELIQLDAAQLERTVAEKEAAAQEARLHGESRVALTRRLARALGHGNAPPRLTELVEALGGEAQDLRESVARVLAITDATRRLLVANAQFAERSFGRVQDTLRLLGQAIPEADAYGPVRATPGIGRGRLVRASI